MSNPGQTEIGLNYLQSILSFRNVLMKKSCLVSHLKLYAIVKTTIRNCRQCRPSSITFEYFSASLHPTVTFNYIFIVCIFLGFIIEYYFCHPHPYIIIYCVFLSCFSLLNYFLTRTCLDSSTVFHHLFYFLYVQ